MASDSALLAVLGDGNVAYIFLLQFMLGFPSVISLMIFFFFGIIMRFSISTPTLHDTLLVLSCKFVCIAQNPCVAAFEMSTHILAYCVAIARFDKE